MSHRQKKNAALAQVKQKLADKYRRLERTAGSQPKRKRFRNKAERYRRQARQLTES